MMRGNWFERLRSQVVLLEREAPPELALRVKLLKTAVRDVETAVQREISDLEHDVARLKRMGRFFV